MPVYTEDHMRMMAAKERLMRRLQTLMPNVRVDTMEDQAAGYRAYKIDFEKSAEAVCDFLIEYGEIVRSIGSDESKIDGPCLRDAVNDWISDEFSSADDWADEVEDGRAAA